MHDTVLGTVRRAEVLGAVYMVSAAIISAPVQQQGPLKLTALIDD